MSKKDDATGQRLLTFWERHDELGHPVGCVSTTFTFDAAFYEEECLGRFVGMDTDPRETAEVHLAEKEERLARVYIVEREDRFAQVFACVLVDSGHVPRARSLRWNVLPIRVPGGGILHAKVSVLAWENCIRVLVGSANLTSNGYRQNFENLGVLEFGSAGGLPLDLLTEILGFLHRLAELAPRRASDAEGPQHALHNFLGKVEAQVANWPQGKWKAGRPSVAFVRTGPAQRSVVEQVSSSLWQGAGPMEAYVLSPFFDEGERARHLVEHVVDHMGTYGDRVLHFLSSGHRLPDGSLEYDVPVALARPCANRCHHRFYLIKPEDENGEPRALHTKSLWLQRHSRAVYVMGSSNFTCAGMGLGPGPINIEANLAYVLPSTSDRFARSCGKAYPPYEELDFEKEEASFRLEVVQDTPEPEAYTRLPDAFGEALFRPEAMAGTLLLSVRDDAPRDFQVSADSAELLSGAQWLAAGQPESVERRWEDKRPPSYLWVKWTDESGENRTSIWVVNVTDGSKLPPPEELRDLPLEVLVDILTSALPLHEAWRRAIRKHRGTDGGGRRGVEVDPHRKVDTRNFLLRRVRRVSDALEGMRLRLERPAYHLEGFRWRLHGPVGPAALAGQLAKEEKDGAAFMIAEVALTLSRTDWSASEKLLGREVVKREVDQVIADLTELARAQPAPSNLERYVRDTLAAVNR
jgi:hypothetical protein